MELVRIETAKINNQDVETVNARELHNFLESKQDFSTWIKSRIESYGFEENIDYCSFHNFVEREIGATKRIEYLVSINMAKELSMVERNEKGRQARQYFINCEKALKSQAPQIPTNLPDALRLAADLAEENQKLAIERDEAIKTKALIGSKREATAMGKAGALAKEVKKLKEQLDQSSQFSSIKRMEIMHSGKSFDWRKLKKASIQLGLPINEIADQNYGSVKTYHAEAWAMVYQLDIAEGV